jgi:hypothetical protein
MPLPRRIEEDGELALHPLELEAQQVARVEQRLPTDQLLGSAAIASLRCVFGNIRSTPGCCTRQFARDVMPSFVPTIS